MIASGAVEDFHAAARDAIISNFAAAAEVEKRVVSLEISAASVRLTVTIEASSQAAAQGTKAMLAPSLQSAAVANALMPNGIVLESTPSIAVSVANSSTSSSPSPAPITPLPPPDFVSSPVAAITGGGGAAVFLFLSIAALVVCRKNRRSRKQKQNGKVGKEEDTGVNSPATTMPPPPPTPQSSKAPEPKVGVKAAELLEAEASKMDQDRAFGSLPPALWFDLAPIPSPSFFTPATPTSPHGQAAVPVAVALVSESLAPPATTAPLSEAMAPREAADVNAKVEAEAPAAKVTENAPAAMAATAPAVGPASGASSAAKAARAKMRAKSAELRLKVKVYDRLKKEISSFAKEEVEQVAMSAAHSEAIAKAAREQLAAQRLQAVLRGNAGRKAAIEERIERMMAFDEAGGDETER